MRRKFFSIFGIVAVVAFFLPWLKACDEVESGFDLLIINSLRDFSANSLSSLNTGFLFLAIPIYIAVLAWLTPRPAIHAEGSTPLPKWVGTMFVIIALLSLCNTGIWSGLEISAIIEEWGDAEHSHAITMIKLFILNIISSIFTIAYLLHWKKTHRFDLHWVALVLIFPLFGILGIGFTFEPIYYGIWLYLFSLIGILLGSILDGILGRRRLNRPPDLT